MENSLTSLTLLYLAVHLLKQRCRFFSGNSISTFYCVISVTLYRKFVMLVSVFFLFQLLINENCRKRSKHIAFYTIDCKDSCGEIFVDLQKHSYVQVCCALEHD
jgi:hypothetical protein